MKKLQPALLAVLISIVVPAFGQQPPLSSETAIAPVSRALAVPYERLFFPHNWARGYTEFEIAPSHNEPDLGRCVSAADPRGPCRAFARYMLSGYLELQPMGRTVLRRVFFFYTPRLSFGDNIPQQSYTASFSPIAYDRSLGFGIELPKNFELRWVRHRVIFMGRYDDNLGKADLHTTGPYGLYSTVGVRWYFGGYGRARAAQ